MDEIQNRLREFNDDVKDLPVIKELSEVTGFPPSFFGTLFLGLGVLIVALNFPYCELLVQTIGIIYPCYKSVQALKTERKDDDKQWLTYWTVFALFTIADLYAHWILTWVPYYWLVKLCFLIYLFNPVTMGAVQIYETILSPLGKAYRQEITDFSRTIHSLTENYEETLKKAS